MSANVKRIIDHIEHLEDEDLMQVIDAIVESFAKRKAKKQLNPGE